MRKNYFKNNLVAASMLLAVSMGMASCSGFIDAVVGTTDTPTTQPTTQPTTPETKPEIKNVTFTAQGAQVSASSADEVNKALAALADDIKEKGVGEGKEYKIEVVTTNTATTTDFIIEIPKVENSNINLVLDDAVATATVPLLVKAAETASASPTASVNNLTITLPDLEGLDLKIDMPETTVSLKSSGTKTTVNSLNAKTALTTTYVGAGIIVKEFMGGTGNRTIIQQGGVVETYVYPSGLKNSDGKAFISVCYDEDLAPYAGVLPPTLKVDETVCYELSTDEKGEKPYLAKYLKVVKGSEDEAEVNFLNQHGHFLEKMTVGDGANVVTRGIRATEIVGDGTAKITFIRTEGWFEPKSGSWHDPTPDNMDEFYWCQGTNGLKGVEKISNIIFAKLRFQDDNLQPVEFVGEYYTFINQVSATLDNCTFQYDCVYFGNDWLDEFGKGTEYTLANDKVIKNCKFETMSLIGEKGYPHYGEGVVIFLPEQPQGGTFKMTFENCEFDKRTCMKACIPLYPYKVVGYNYWSSDGSIQNSVTSIDDIPAGYLDNTDGGYSYQLNQDEERYNFVEVNLVFNNCTIGGSALTATTDVFPDPNRFVYYDPSGITFNFTCNNSSGTTTGKWIYGVDPITGDEKWKFY